MSCDISEHDKSTVFFRSAFLIQQMILVTAVLVADTFIVYRQVTGIALNLILHKNEIQRFKKQAGRQCECSLFEMQHVSLRYSKFLAHGPLLQSDRRPGASS